MYHYCEFSRIQPQGWLRQQLEIQAKGLSGNLDKIWPDIKDSAWIGGNKEGWERVPYWLDGFIPLAYLLKDQDMIARADAYINAILDRQQPDGWICPCAEEERAGYDVWAFFLIGKVLSLYCQFTKSRRAQKGLYKAMKCLKTLMDNKTVKLFSWGKFRWFEAFIPLQFLYEKYKEDWILDLARTIEAQGANYPDYKEQWKVTMNQWTHQTHIVNLCMMIKYEAVACQLLGRVNENRIEELWKILEQYNGTAVGTFTGDECLSGLANNQGTELCSVAELAYSCELLYAITKKRIWADRLEKAVFNAWPATNSDDMWTHQYDQMVNQIACIRFPGRSMFRTNGEESHLFGLEPNFGCCTANMNQTWPKLVLHTFLKSRGGITCAMMLPASLETTMKGAKISVTMETQYPFRNCCKYIVKVDKPVTFSLKIRIPGWAESVSVNGAEVTKKPHITINKEWNGTEELVVTLGATPKLVSRPNNLKAVEYGALVFALPIETEYKMKEYERDGVVRKFPYCDYELYPKSAWNYGFASKDFTVCEKEGDSIPFSSKHPRITLKAKMCHVPWDYADGFATVADKAPKSNKAISAPIEMELVPYGCAKLRMTEMPLIKD